jgi:anti-sigma factor RsiW
MDCRELEGHFAAYVEGQAGAARADVESHLQRCPPCRTRIAAERAAHELLQARRGELKCQAPAALRHRCAALRPAPPPRSLVRRALLPLSLAATLLLAAGAVLLFGVGTNLDTYTAQLALDHRKCFQFPPEAPPVDIALLGRAWETQNGWPLKIAGPSPSEDLELVGIRRCGSTRGRVAHVLYRWHDEPLSMYVLNDTLQDEDRANGGGEHSVYKLGEHAIVWSERGRTYAVVARRQVPHLEQVAGFLRQAVE